MTSKNTSIAIMLVVLFHDPDRMAVPVHCFLIKNNEQSDTQKCAYALVRYTDISHFYDGGAGSSRSQGTFEVHTRDGHSFRL